MPQWIDEKAIYTFVSSGYLKFVINPTLLKEKIKNKYPLGYLTYFINVAFGSTSSSEPKNK
jgi:hypothetical protein